MLGQANHMRSEQGRHVHSTFAHAVYSRCAGAVHARDATHSRTRPSHDSVRSQRTKDVQVSNGGRGPICARERPCAMMFEVQRPPSTRAIGSVRRAWVCAVEVGQPRSVGECWLLDWPLTGLRLCF